MSAVFSKQRASQIFRFRRIIPVMEPHAVWPQIETIYPRELARFVSGGASG